MQPNLPLSNTFDKIICNENREKQIVCFAIELIIKMSKVYSKQNDKSQEMQNIKKTEYPILDLYEKPIMGRSYENLTF